MVSPSPVDEGILLAGSSYIGARNRVNAARRTSSGHPAGRSRRSVVRRVEHLWAAVPPRLRGALVYWPDVRFNLKVFSIRVTSRGATPAASACLPQSRTEALTLSNTFQRSALFHANGGGELKNIVTLKAVPAPSQTHLVVAGRCAAGIVGVGDVISRGQGPFPGPVHQERDVLHVVILVCAL